MAKAYLGKISALVTANTSDFNSKLNASAKEVRSFAASMQSTLSRAQTSATTSLRGIYTESQKVSRALQAVATQRLSFKGFDNSAVGSIREAVDQFRALQAASVAVNEPLNSAARTVERLSASVQQSFDPALKSAQKSAEYLDAALKRGGIVGEQSFERIRQKAVAATEAANRLAEASQLASVGPRGRELAFAAPQVRDALAASADVRQRAANAPASALDGGRVSSDVQKLVAIDNLIQKRRAEIESGTILNIDTTQARASLENLLAVAKRVRDQINTAIGGGPDAETATLINRARAQREFYQESERLQRQAAQDAAAPLINRARAEREYYEESTRLANQAAADAAAPLIARARAEREFYEESERLQRQAAQDEAAPLIARARAEREFYEESTRLANQAAADAAAPLIARARAEREYYEESERLQRQAAEDAAAPLINRARAEREYYEESTRLANQAAADAAAPLIARARAEREFYEESERLQRQAASDEAALLSRRARAQQEFDEERRRRDAIAASDAAEEIAPAINRGRAQRESAIDFGLDLDAPRRQIEVLRGSIVSLKGQLDTLPAGVRSQFIPAIIAAQQNLEALAATPAATTAELSRAAREVDRLTQAFNRARQAANIPSFRRFASELSTRTAVGELQALQTLLSRIGAQAGGPAAQAYDRYAAALRRATREGTTQLPETRRELERLQIAAARAAAETGRISFRGALREIRRGGDIARGGFDNFSLAINQAAFAIDDFFSSTGGLEFKLRAISNNITQLAFILGGTQGLFIGLGAVIGGQLAVAITKFVNEGRTAEDQTKALNDALSRQKSLVEELAQAFRTLGDSLTRDAFSPAAQKANDFRRELDEIVKKQKELREARVADLDPTVQRERATQGSLQRRLESETNIGRRVDIQQQLEQSRRREREAAAAAAARQAPTGRQAQDAIEQAGQALFANRTRGQEVVTARDTAVLDEARARAGAAAAALTPAAIRDLLTQQRDTLVQSGEAASDTGVANAIARLEELIAALEAPVRRANDALVIAVLEGAKKVSDALAAAQTSIANADFGGSQIGAQADAVARQLESLATQIEAATDEKTIQALQQQQEALLKQSDALRSAASAVEQFASVVERNARQLSNTVLQEVDSREMQARRSNNAANGARFVDVEIERGTRSSLGEGLSPSQRGRAVRDRERRFSEALEDRRRARAELARAREGQRQFELRRSEGVRQFEQDISAGALGDDAKQLIQQRDAARAKLDAGGLDPFDIKQEEEKLAAAIAGLATLFAQSPIAESLERFSNQLDAQAQMAVEVTRRIEAERESVSRGRELSQTPGERASEELAQQIQDIRNYFNQAAEESTGLPEDIAEIRAKMEEAIGRAEEDMMRQVAPMITGMADSVRNAVLSGPSRAALNASDVTTTQGQQELNRLLRGDDPARDVDLVALQREANRLLEVIANKETPVAG